MDVLSCTCGKSFRRRCDLTKHQRYHCRGQLQTSTNSRENTCALCNRVFNTFIGLRQHQRLAHPVEYNAEAESSDNRVYNTWSRLEDYELASEELAYEGINVNQHLATIFTHRSLDAIKSHRRLKSYKELVETIRLERLEAAPDPEPISNPETSALDLSCSTEDKENHSVISFEYHPPHGSLSRGSSHDAEQFHSSNGDSITPEPISPPLPPAPSSERHNDSCSSRVSSNESDQASHTLNPLADMFTPTDADTVADYLLLLSRCPSFPQDLVEQTQQCIATEATSSQLLNTLLQRIVSLSKPEGAPRARNYSNQNRTEKQGAAKRAYLYKKAQKLYKSNRAQLANSLIEGTFDRESYDFPDIAAVEESYRTIFETPSKDDNDYIDSYIDHNISIYQPITLEEVKKTLNSRMSEAAGVDLIKPSDLRKVPIPLIAMLFNLMLYAGETPQALKRCRTTLIPKGGSDLLNVNSWRPITVTSAILRIFNRILASRFRNLPFHYSQRGFLEVDGTLANTLTLQAAIKSLRRASKPHCITTLDLRKAFDSVSKYSIERALRRFSIEPKIIKLIMSSYDNVSTTIKCGPYNTQDIQMLRGVRQGDPLSPLLFNMVMDELLCDLHKKPYGLKVDNISLTALAYADDLVIFTESPTDAQSLVRACERFLQRRQMGLNADKCTILCARLLPNRKKLYVARRSTVYANGGLIPSITVGQQFKYLGFKYSFTGAENPKSTNIHQQLDRISKAPLKPWQKIVILNAYLLPRYMYILQAPNISLKTLTSCDKSIRRFTKKVLHLPSSTPSSFIYAAARSGGLGITCFATKIPSILWRRICNLDSNGDPSLEALKNTGYVRERVQCLERMLQDTGTDKSSESAFWTFKLDTSICGNGIASVGKFPGSSDWITNPPPFWSGRDYINAILLRANLLPVRGGVHNEPGNRSCRAGCNKSESLSHVLQRCPVTHYERINRHDRVVRHIATCAKKKGWEVQIEPRLRDSDNNLRKPDLVLVNSSAIIVCDVGIHWEGPEPLDVAASDKIRHYSNCNLERILHERHPNRSLRHLPLIVGARGGWYSGNDRLLNAIAVSIADRRSIIYDVLKGGWSIHRAFSSKVWEN